MFRILEKSRRKLTDPSKELYLLSGMLSRKAVNLNQKKVHSSRVISFIIRETHADTQIVTISMSPMAVVRISVVYVMTKMLTPK